MIFANLLSPSNGSDVLPDILQSNRLRLFLAELSLYPANREI